MVEEKTTALSKIEEQTGNLPSINWRDKEGIALVKSIVAKGCTETEFQYLFYMANKYGLDPLKKEVYCVKYGNNPAQIFISRDGAISIAHRSGKFEGMETTVEFEKEPKEPEKGKITYVNRKSKLKPFSATCIIHKKGSTHSFSETVYFSEYDQGHALWVSKPVTMIKKVAEAQCLRKAFNIHGLYDQSEFPEDE